MSVAAGIGLVGTTLALAVVLVMMEFGLWARHGSLEAGPAHSLPAPATSGGMTLAEALARRRSVREFEDRPLSPDQVAQLCWAAQGVTDQGSGFRASPSAGALYPLTVFVVGATGASAYDPGTHSLREVIAGDARGRLQSAALGQPCVGDAPVCLVIAANVGRTAAKYGHRAEQYCLLEAGHAGQNVLLQATALGLGAVPVGAFNDDAVAKLLRLPNNLRPVYLIPVGHPAGN